MVTKDKQERLQEKMRELEIFEEDIEEKFILGSGPGGQKINKSSSTVYLRHGPSGIEIKCGRSRSREMNRYLARKELCLQTEEKQDFMSSTRGKKQAKLRKQKKRRDRRSVSKCTREE